MLIDIAVMLIFRTSFQSCNSVIGHVYHTHDLLELLYGLESLFFTQFTLFFSLKMRNVSGLAQQAAWW